VLSTTADMRPAHRLYERLGFGRAVDRDWTPRPNLALIAYTLELAA
jgi:hypothetical protein